MSNENILKILQEAQIKTVQDDLQKDLRGTGDADD